VRSIALVVALAAILVVPPALAAGGRLAFADDVPPNKWTSVEIRTSEPATFRVVLRVPIAGRAQLFLTGKGARRGGPLIDTITSNCEGAAGSFTCRATYAAVRPGKYRWRLRWIGRRPAHVELGVRW
jgi:hypothetical protein